MTDQQVPAGGGEDLAVTRPAELPPPVPEDLLGRRIAAALIDLAVLAALLVILSAATGDFTTSRAGFTFALRGAWIGVFLLIVPMYYLVLESWTGQTLGKLLLDLRVLHAGGTRPSVGAVILRTLLRIVDWLPLLYLAGFITVLATGSRGQRIGDLAAQTVLARAARPARDRSLALLPLAAVVIAAVVLPVSRSNPGGGQTYQGHGVTFAYPAGWSEATPRKVTATGDLLWTAVVGPGTQQDAIAVQGFHLRAPVTTQNVAAVVPELAQVIRGSGDIIDGQPHAITMAGLPGVEFDVTYGRRAAAAQSRLVFAFSGTTEYLVNCHYTPARAAEIRQGCDQVLNTFHMT